MHGDSDRLSLRPLTTKIFSSAPTKAALGPRKYAAVTGAPIAIGTTLSVTEMMEADSPGSKSVIA